MKNTMKKIISMLMVAIMIMLPIASIAEDLGADVDEAAIAAAAAAEEAARKTEEKASADAELMLQRAQEDSNAFWQDVNELLQKRLFSDGGADHGE